MADISKCKDEACPSKLKCYRFMAPSNDYWQSYGSFQRKENEDNCNYFWNNENK